MSDEAWAQLTELSIICGMNQRYWSCVESAAGGWLLFTILAVFLGFGVIVSLIVAFTSEWKWGLLAVVLAAPLLVAPFSDIPAVLPRDLPSPRLSKQWGDLKREIDLAIVDEDANQTQVFRRKIVELNSTEPNPPSVSLLERCLVAEEKSRGVK